MTRLRNRTLKFIDLLLANGYNIFNPNVKPELPEGWAKFAACKDADPDIFFPETGSDYVVATRIAEAKRICGTCSVESECLATALMRREKNGVWGGTSWPERKNILGSYKTWRMRGKGMADNDDVYWSDRASSV